jgi:tRNA threonylcarbamoyladenosine biosynthesis protein TsaB
MKGGAGQYNPWRGATSGARRGGAGNGEKHLLVLAVDTTTERESVAVVADGQVRAELRLRQADVHSRRLMPAIVAVLEAAALPARSIEGYAVTVGPGSFTGLRVGISTVQGLALAARRSCLGWSALDVHAARIEGAAPVLAVMAEAHRGEVFGGVYDAQARPLAPAVAETPEAFLDRVPPGPVAFAGEAALRCRDLVLSRRPDAVFPRRSLYVAATLGLLAEPRLAAGEGGPPEALRPLYLRETAYRKSSA